MMKKRKTHYVFLIFFIFFLVFFILFWHQCRMSLDEKIDFSIFTLYIIKLILKCISSNPLFFYFDGVFFSFKKCYKHVELCVDIYCHQEYLIDWTNFKIHRHFEFASLLSVDSYHIQIMITYFNKLIKKRIF